MSVQSVEPATDASQPVPPRQPHRSPMLLGYPHGYWYHPPAPSLTPTPAGVKRRVSIPLMLMILMLVAFAVIVIASWYHDNTVPARPLMLGEVLRPLIDLALRG